MTQKTPGYSPAKAKKRISCELCDKTVQTYLELAFHQTKVHSLPFDFAKFKDKVQKCQEQGCEFFTIYREVFVRHQKQHGRDMPYQCSVCKQQFPSERLHQRHLQTHNSSKPFTCDKCAFTTASKYSLKMHKKSLHNEGSEKLLCATCPKTFVSQQELWLHVVKNHPQVETPSTCKIFQCPHCDYKSTKKYALDQHIKRHNNEKTFQCSYCWKKFNVYQDSKNHEKSHSDHRYECGMPGCSYTSKKKTLVDAHHRKVHHNSDQVKVYSCRQSGGPCDYVTTDHRNFRKHIQVVHSMKLASPAHKRVCKLNASSASSSETMDKMAVPETTDTETIGTSDNTPTAVDGDISAITCRKNLLSLVDNEQDMQPVSEPSFSRTVTHNNVIDNKCPIAHIDPASSYSLLDRAMTEIVPKQAASSGCPLDDLTSFTEDRTSKSSVSCEQQSSLYIKQPH